MRALVLPILALLAAAPSHAQWTEEQAREEACPAEHRLEMRQRLETLREQDRADRSGGVAGAEVDAHDRERRREVAVIFAEGCFETGRDYHNAAQVFQHGDTPEHYYQAYVWAQRAVDLGDAEAGWLIPRAIDRYLMHTGYKQLFATNLHCSRAAPEEPMTCCVWPTAEAIDDAQRAELGVNSLAEQLERARRMNDGREDGECEMDLPDPPQGVFPGVW